MQIQENQFLKNLTTFKIGGKIDFFIDIKNIDELKEALAFAKKKKIPFKIIGGGSNILASDEGYKGLVIKNSIKGIEYTEREDGVRVVSGAGEVWDDLVGDTVERDLFGLENLSLIPGSVGASPIQNIGAYGSEVKQTIEWVEVCNAQTGDVKKIPNTECEFAYRNSVFKKEENNHLIVTRVSFLLQKKGLTFIGYRDLADYFVRRGVAKATPKEVRKAVIEIRTLKMPDLNKVGTAGSFFKNPVVTSEEYDGLKKRFPLIPGHAEDGAMKVSAAWIIDKLCNLKNLSVGDACVNKNQALVLINGGNATEKQIDSLAKKISQAVLEKTGIVLEREVRSI